MSNDTVLLSLYVSVNLHHDRTAGGTYRTRVGRTGSTQSHRRCGCATELCSLRALLVGRGESMHREERLANPDTNPRLRAAQDHTWRWSGAGDSSEPVPTFMLGPFAKVRRV